MEVNEEQPSVRRFCETARVEEVSLLGTTLIEETQDSYSIAVVDEV